MRKNVTVHAVDKKDKHVLIIEVQWCCWHSLLALVQQKKADFQLECRQWGWAFSVLCVNSFRCCLLMFIIIELKWEMVSVPHSFCCGVYPAAPYSLRCSLAMASVASGASG